MVSEACKPRDEDKFLSAVILVASVQIFKKMYITFTNPEIDGHGALLYRDID